MAESGRKIKCECTADADIRVSIAGLPSSSCTLALCSRCHSEALLGDITKCVVCRTAKLCIYLESSNEVRKDKQQCRGCRGCASSC